MLALFLLSPQETCAADAEATTLQFSRLALSLDFHLC